MQLKHATHGNRFAVKEAEPVFTALLTVLHHGIRALNILVFNFKFTPQNCGGSKDKDVSLLQGYPPSFISTNINWN